MGFWLHRPECKLDAALRRTCSICLRKVQGVSACGLEVSTPLPHPRLYVQDQIKVPSGVEVKGPEAKTKAKKVQRSLERPGNFSYRLRK